MRHALSLSGGLCLEAARPLLKVVPADVLTGLRRHRLANSTHYAQCILMWSLIGAATCWLGGTLSMHALQAVNGYPMEPSPSAVAAVEYALRRLCNWLVHGEPANTHYTLTPCPGGLV